MNRQSFIFTGLILLAACTSEIPMVNLGIDDTYYISRMSKLPLESALTGDAYVWKVNGEEVSTDRSYVFIARDEGSYDLSFDIIDERTPYHFDFTVNVLHEDVEYSPYISKVYEYCPAPGQFVNEMPRYEEGDSYADILQKAEESISGTNDIMITLGGFGGYVTFGFDHSVINVPGEYDFRIWGNSFYELTDTSRKGGSAEPGIVMVSYDWNCNGIPDDEWYELAGSSYHNTSTIHNYMVSYKRPDVNRIPVPDESGYLSDTEYIPWHDSEGTDGFIPMNIFHTQSYWPEWIEHDELNFSGTRLPPNAVDTSGIGRYFILYCFDWGYVDNHPNDYADLNSFKIDWAVDSCGCHVDLPAIDFVRVYTGLNQYCGWLGETSTELCRAADLHIKDLTGILPQVP
ncbi:MAG: cell surface protein [Muribaculaceae bacterium]|nr:cell surface protein [Muribaculaceae bacterium]MDE6552910.1 cell surface protein [Muribaculaceae bacterium]